MGLCLSVPKSSNITPEQQEFCEQQITKAIIHSTHDDYDAALAHIENAIKFNPYSASAYFTKATILQSKGEKALGIAVFTEVVKIDSKFLQIFITKIGMKDPSFSSAESKQALRKILKMKAKCADDYEAKGNIWLKLDPDNPENKRNAIEMYKKALELRPGDALIASTIGDLYCDLGETDIAIEYLELAIKLDPEWEACIHNLAVLYKDLGRYDEALETFNKKLQLKNIPDPILVYCSRGDLLYKMNKIPEAMEDFKKAKELMQDPKNLEHTEPGNIPFINSMLEFAMKEIDPNLFDSIENPAQKAELKKEAEKIHEEKVQLLSMLTSKSGKAEFAIDSDMMEKIKAMESKISMLQAELAQKADSHMVSYAIKMNLKLEEKEAKLSKIQSDTNSETGGLKEYYFGFTATLSTAWTGAAAIHSKYDIAFNTGNIGVSAVAAAAGVFGASEVVKTAWDIYKTSDVKGKSSNILKVASTADEFGKIVSDLGVAMTLSNEQRIKDSERVKIAGSFFGKIISKLGELGTSISELLNPNIYDTPLSKLGRDDALEIISAIESGKIDLASADLIGQCCANLE